MWCKNLYKKCNNFIISKVKNVWNYDWVILYIVFSWPNFWNLCCMTKVFFNNCFSSVCQLSLFFDVMMPMATGVTEADFVDGKWSRAGSPNDPETQKRMRKARSLLWKELGEYKIWACKYMEFRLKKRWIPKYELKS